MQHCKTFCLFCLLTVLVWTGCQSIDPIASPHRAAYYWKTRFNWTREDAALTTKLGIGKLYIRLFDIVYDSTLKDTRPEAPITGLDTFPKGIEAVPVIYITYKALINTPDTLVSELAGRITMAVDKMTQSLPGKISEIQIDCDWTASSRDRYFALLSAIRSNQSGNKGKIISATIRLHQVKFLSKMGIPPVDRGMLMVYNMGRPDLTGNMNSILDLKSVAAYTQKLSTYPLQLDMALPLFSWGVLFRQGRYRGIIRGLSEDALVNTNRIKRISANRFQAVNPCRVSGIALETGDIIRLDLSDPKVVHAAGKLVASRLSGTQTTLALFSFDKRLLQSSTGKKLYEIFN